MAESILLPDETEEILFKILVVGDIGVGKTSFVHRYTMGRYSDAYKSTIGSDFASKKVKWSEKMNIDIHLWDLAGQERLGTQVRVYFRETDAAICIFDITDKKSYDRVLEWKSIVCENSTHSVTKEHYSPPCILLANKFDLIPYGVITDLTELDLKAKENGFVSGTVISAKENSGIDDAMMELITLLLENRRLDSEKGIRPESGTMIDIVDLGDYSVESPVQSYYSCGRC